MRSRFQFGLRWVLAAPVIAGAIMAGMTTAHEATALVALQLILFAQFGSAAAMAWTGSRASRAFGIGAMCPAIIGVLFVAKSLVVEPVDWNLSGFDVLIHRNLKNHHLDLSDLRFRVGFLLIASLVGGIAAIIAVWLTQPNCESDREKIGISE